MMLIEPPASGFQNRLPPQMRQKPRRAVAEDSYQVSPRSSTKLRSPSAQRVAHTKCPLVLRHWLQWHATTLRSGPRTS